MEEKTKSGFGTASLVLGIIGIVFSFIPLINYLAFILGFLALIFGIVCLVKKASKGQAIAGLILAIISLFMAYSMHQGLKTAVDEVSSAFDSSKAAIVNLNVGESTTTDDNLKITFVSSSDYTGYNSYFAPATGNKIIQVKVDFQNNGTSDEYLSGFECYADNAKCEDYFYADDTKSPTLESVSSGKSFSSIVYFEVPKNAEHITVEYTTNVLNSSKVILNVK